MKSLACFQFILLSNSVTRSCHAFIGSQQKYEFQSRRLHSIRQHDTKKSHRKRQQHGLQVIRNILEESVPRKTGTMDSFAQTQQQQQQVDLTENTSWEPETAVSYNNFLLQTGIAATTTTANRISSAQAPSQEEECNKNKHRLFANLPVEADQQLTIDQRIMGLILKEPVVEVIDTLLVLLSSFLVALSTLNSIDLKTYTEIIKAENLIALVFAVEFFVRWYSSFRWKGVLQHLTKPLVIVDLLVVIVPMIPLLVPNTADGVYSLFPSWVFSSSGLINLRLLRVLRLQRVLADIDTFTDFQMALGIKQSDVKPYKLQLARVLLSVFTLLSISAGLIYSTEHTVNPNIPDYFTAMYFCLTTITTVGFGDITPVTPEGKLVVSGTILAGVAIIPTQTAALVEALFERNEMEEQTGDSPTSKATLPPPPTLPSSYGALSSSSLQQQQQQQQPLGEGSRIVNTIVCDNCGANYHWEKAKFCYSCGTPFMNSGSD